MLPTPSRQPNPALPPHAISAIRKWEAEKKIAAYRLLSEVEGERCWNCHDEREVLVSFLGDGPTRIPSTSKKPSTYIEGKGWYVIEQTIAFDCPTCQRGRIIPQRPLPLT